MKKNRKFNRHSIILFFIGLGALVWFLVRVIPKPSRATYPCQQAAFPFASAFVIWLTGILTSSFVFVKAKHRWRLSKYVVSFALFFLAMGIFVVTTTSLKYTPAVAKVIVLTSDIFGGPLSGMQDFTDRDENVVEPFAYVGIAKSVQAQAEDIEFSEIETMVGEAIEKAGGLEGIVNDGDTVVLKPNLVVSVDGTAAAQQLEPEVNGVTTDFRVIQAIVNIVRGINPSGQIYIIEGSAADGTANNMNILGYNNITGIDSLICLEDACGGWQDTISNENLVRISLPPGKALYEDANNRYWLYKLYYQADAVISVPVLKNHFHAGNTGSIKNVGIGATPPNVYGYAPGNILRFGIDHGADNTIRLTLHYWIHDFFMCRPVDFVVMDGLQSVQNGPVSTNSTAQLSDDQMNMRLIMASNDPLAIDAIGSLLTGHDPAYIPHVFELHNDSLGCSDGRLIRVLGNKVGDEKKDFEITNSGLLSKYYDFEPPVFSVNLCEIIDNQLHLVLTVDDEVTKVEVSADGNYLNQIVIGGFDDIYLDLDTLEVNNETKLLVYAYDQYLNYSMEDVTGWVGVGGAEMDVIDLTVYPNPCSGTVFLRYLIHDICYLKSDLYMISGDLIRELERKEVSPGEYEMEIDVSDLPAGLYFIKMQLDNMFLTKKFIKMEP